jgi:hypothetical protein
MTPSPKEKAKELVNKYTDTLWNLGISINKQSVVQCSIIAVNEILETLPIKKLSDAELHDYWVTVKTELEKL